MAVIMTLAAAGVVSTAAAEPQAKGGRAAIYDEKADGEVQVKEALDRARKEGRRVLLQFGANWCGWCHKLHKLFQSDPAIAACLKASYIVVLVDVNDGHNAEVNRRYGNPMQHGLPVIVILDANGKPLVTQDTGKLEAGDHHDPEKILAFLRRWAPVPPAPAGRR